MDLFSSVSSSTLFYYLSFLVYIVIGYFLANCNSLGDMIGEKKIILSTFIIAVFLYFAYIFYYVVPASNLNGHFTYFGYLNPVIMIISINIFVLFKYLSKTKFFSGLEGNGAGSIISLISRYSFGIYLTHYLVLKESY